MDPAAANADRGKSSNVKETIGAGRVWQASLRDSRTANCLCARDINVRIDSSSYLTAFQLPGWSPIARCPSFGLGPGRSVANPSPARNPTERRVLTIQRCRGGRPAAIKPFGGEAARWRWGWNALM